MTQQFEPDRASGWGIWEPITSVLRWIKKGDGANTRCKEVPRLSSTDRRIVDEFHSLYYGVEGQPGTRTYCINWFGHMMFKCPLDLWTYQEIIHEQRPDLIIETGTHRGGSALYLATICDLVGKGRVVTIDIDEAYAQYRPSHPRIEYLVGSSTAPGIVARVFEMAKRCENTLVILDSDHRRDHVAEELRIYSQLIPKSGYLIVEDTNVNGHPVYKSFGPGPWEAVHDFLATRQDFQIDRSCERFLLTMNPEGFLRRVA